MDTLHHEIVPAALPFHNQSKRYGKRSYFERRTRQGHPLGGTAADAQNNDQPDHFIDCPLQQLPSG